MTDPVRRWAWLAAGLAGVLLLGCWLALGLAAGDGPWGPDAELVSVVTGWRGPALTGVVRVANAVLAPVLGWAAAGLIVLAGGVAARRRAWRQVRLAAVWLVVYVACWRGVVAVKPLLDRPRPAAAAALEHASGASYPSGHVAAVAAVGALLAAVAVWRRRRRLPALVAAAAAPLAAGFDRVYLGVHYPTDVAGSLCGVWGCALIVAAVWARRTAVRSTATIPIT